MIIYLIRFGERPAHDRRSETAATGHATMPEDQPRKVRYGTGCSSLCSVLHRMGFFLPRKLLRER